ncbi:MAG: DUF2785 domain-containing protein [Vicinamibacterales bacterium]
MLTFLSALVTVGLAAGQAVPVHPKTFWRAVAEAKFEVPAGQTAATLTPELTAALGSPDPELRDDLAFATLSNWIYRRRLLTPDDLRPMVRTLQDNLRSGIGETGTDAVLLRSFSALTLSVIAARDNEEPFLTADEYSRLLDSAISYFHDERDTRGFDADKGWMHSVAHTSDLLKFLARNTRLPVAGQARLLSAILLKTHDTPAVFAEGEDERMARVVISVVRRSDFDRAPFRQWLGAAATAAAFPKTPDSATLRAQQNVRHLLTSLWTELSVDERPSEGADFAKSALRDMLKGLF